ncbi:MAG: thioredoxin family protein [Bacteroidota bacterium]
MRSLLIIVLLSFSFGIAEENWKTNFDDAKKEAAANEKIILLSFSGSDWCSNCIRLEKTLFESDEFSVFAKEHLVLLKADFPMRKANKLSKDQQQHNDALAEKYNKKGKFPAVFLLNEKGEVLGQMGHPYETPSEYIANIKTLIP